MDGFERIEIPTPFDIGTVNCYLFTDGPLTIIDPGPDTDEAHEALTAALHDRGRSVAEVDHVLITHPHIDHFGLTARVVAQAGATVVAHEHAAAIVADMPAHFRREQAFFEPFLRSMGLPDSMADVVTKVPEPYLAFQAAVDVDRFVDDGDTITAGPTFDCYHTPGHAPGSICFRPADGDVMFTGDHVLADITPNPVLSVRPDGSDDRTRSLPTYLASLKRLRSVDATRGYGGHRGPIDDLHGRVDETLSHHRTRREDVAERLEAAGPTTPYALMKELFPGLPTTEVFLGMSEVIGHLDLLEAADRVDVSTTDGVTRYAVTDA